MTSHRLLGAIYLALSVVMIAWDILAAGRIAGLRRIPRGFQAITGIAGEFIVELGKIFTDAVGVQIPETPEGLSAPVGKDQNK